MKKLTLILLTFSSFVALANEAFINKVQFGGNGCGQDEAIAVLSPDGHTISLLFDNFVVEAGGDLGKKAHKQCQISLDIAVPENKRVVLKKIDYRGYALIPEKARMRFISSYHIEIPSLNFNTKNFRDKIFKIGEFDDDIFFEQSLKQRVLKKACGQDFKLKISNKLVVVSKTTDDVMASIDSLDSGINYHLEYEDCFDGVIRTPEMRAERRALREQARRENQRNLQTREERRERRMRAGRPNRATREQLRDENRRRMRLNRGRIKRKSVSV